MKKSSAYFGIQALKLHLQKPPKFFRNDQKYLKIWTVGQKLWAKNQPSQPHMHILIANKFVFND